jgi:aminoglycoside phosphotransferase (APT) family kinase protein
MTASRRDLTDDPPRDALAWVARLLGADATVRSVEPLVGARSSAVHGVEVERGSGTVEQYVLRRYVDDAWLAREPDLAEREAEVLRLLEAGDVPSPVLAGVDPHGTEAGVPSVLMSRLEGRTSTDADLPDRIDDLATLLCEVHASPVPATASVRAYRPYYTGAIDPRESELVPPVWSSAPAMWERAISFHRSWVHPGTGPLLHRDFHPGNVLFDRGQLTGLVDWANASLGPPSLDVGHCRANLVAELDRAAADRFRDRWLAGSGADNYDPTADILAVVGLLPDWLGRSRAADLRLEGLVARALADLGVT